MKIADYLAVPYLLTSCPVENEVGRWLRRVEYPELPDCAAEAPDLLDALDQLDRKRVRLIVELLRAGRRPIVPRPPLPRQHPGDELARLGLAELVPLLELDELNLAAESSGVTREMERQT